MNDKLKLVLGGISVLAVSTAIIWALAGNNLAMKKVFAPAHEQVRRDTFEQSKAYQEGMVQELRAMHFEYIQASPEHKSALASVIRHRVADFPVDQLPADLQSFVQEIQ